jgi:signal transduction histidine kinase
MSGEGFWQRLFNVGTVLRGGAVQAETVQMLRRCAHVFSEASDTFNAQDDNKQLPLTVDFRDDEAQPQANSPYVRCFVINPFWVISVRGFRGTIEFFLFPAVELLSFVRAETPSRLKLKLELRTVDGSSSWFMSESQLEEDELKALVLGLFKDLIKASRADLAHAPNQGRSPLTQQSAIGLVKNLVSDRHRLMSALVEEQESTKRLLAMEIHDDVIGDILFLRRSVLGERELSPAEIAQMLADIADRLRLICADLSPSDLHDWGLPMMLRDLIKRYAERSDCKMQFSCPDELPQLPDDVQMHVFRIMQECLTNASKHSQATELQVTVEVGAQEVSFTVSDNGVGFIVDEVERDQSGHHLGSLILRERTELIATQMPASLTVQSVPGSGTTVCLLLQCNASDNDGAA